MSPEPSLEAAAVGRVFAAAGADPSRLRDAFDFSLHKHRGFRQPIWLFPEDVASLIGAFDWCPVKEALQTESEHFIDCARQSTASIPSGSMGLRVVHIPEITPCSIAEHVTPIKPKRKFGKRRV